MNMERPTPEVLANRKAWVEALRSGEYKKIKGRLCNFKGHCVLGVGLEVLIKRGYDIRKVSPRVNSSFARFNGAAGSLPLEAQDAFGVDSTGRIQYPVKGIASLLTLNDATDYTFDQLADVIEDQFITPYEVEAK